jgi:hypothetical protein
MRLGDAVNCGAASGLIAAATDAARFAALTVSHLEGVSIWWLLVAAAAGVPFGLIVMQKVYMRKALMLERWVVVALWSLATAALATQAMLPAHLHERYAWFAGGCLVAFGIGASPGHLVQNHILARLKRSDGHHHAESPATEGAALSERWALLTRICAGLLSGGLIETVGVRQGLLALAGAVGVYAVAQTVVPLPAGSPGSGEGGFRAVVGRNPEIRSQMRQTFYLYAAKEGLPAVLPLYGAGPFVQAAMAAFSRGMAALLAGRLGRLGRRDRRLATVVGATMAALCVGLVGGFGPAAGWVPSGLADGGFEVGCMSAGAGLKGENASGKDQVRKLLAANMVRFTAIALMQLALTAFGFYLSQRISQPLTGRVLLCSGVAVALVAIVVTAPRSKDPGYEPIETLGRGRVQIAVLPSLPGSDVTICWVYADGSPLADKHCPHCGDVKEARGWAFYPVSGDRVFGRGDVIVIQAGAEPATNLVKIRGITSGHARDGDMFINQEVPRVSGVPGWPTRGLKLVGHRAGAVTRVGDAIRFCSEHVPVSVTEYNMRGQIPFELMLALLAEGADVRIPDHMAPYVDPHGMIRVYTLDSDAFGRPERPKDLHVRAWLGTDR